MRQPSSMTRRQAVTGIAAAGAALALPAPSRAAMIDRLALFGPPAGPSVTLAHAVASGKFADIAQESTFTAWRNPDELRAGLTSGQILLSVVPVQAAANLNARGFPIRLANVMTNGLLYIISSDTGISSVAELAGRSLAVPFRGDTPEIILGQLLAHHGMDGAKHLSITYAASPIEAVQLLLSGRVDAALTAEPSTTAGILRGKQAGKQVRRVINIQDEWGEMTGADSVLPQAGLAMTDRFLADHRDSVRGVLSALGAATADVLANPSAAAANATEALGLPAPLLAASIPYCNLVARPAAEARTDIERMLKAMAGENLERIGGKLPDDSFYL